MRGHPRAAAQPTTRYSDDFERDAEEQSEAPVVNVSPWESRFEIATVPGSKPRRYVLQPGKQVSLQIGYTLPFIGASRQPVRPTIESLTEIEVYPKGPKLPMVVHIDRAHEMRAKWEAELAKGQKAPEPIKVSLPSADGGEPLEMMVTPANAPMARGNVPKMAPLDDVEDQDGQLDEPPPDHNDPLPVELPSAPAATGPAPTGKPKGGR